MQSCSAETISIVERLLREVCEPYERGAMEVVEGGIGRALRILGCNTSMDPADLRLWANFARHLAGMWVFPDRLDLLFQLLWIYPWDAEVHSDLLLCLHYLPDVDRFELAGQHRRWARLHAPSHPAGARSLRDPDPDRRLRVGYLSADLRSHCVPFFLEPLLEGHDRNRFEVFGYGNVPPSAMDPVTQRLVANFDGYRCLWGVEDRPAAQAIAEDQIDILVDLGGHTHHNRLPLLTYKPAPIQVSYLGYPDTTGVAQIDYRLTDRIADLPDAQQYYTETLVYLDTCFAAYRPSEYAPQVAPPPVLTQGVVTFGSFTGSAKHSEVTLSLWAEVLKANPGSDLLLRFEGADMPQVRQRCRQAFVRLGIEPSRVRFDGFRDPATHLAMYGRIDIALDTYPWSSHTTLCEALYMGVPVISLSGQGFVSRTGHSVLLSLGMESLAARSGREYVAMATALAKDTRRLSILRQGLRDRMLGGPVCDGRLQAGAVEQAYRSMWRKGCQAGQGLPREDRSTSPP